MSTVAIEPRILDKEEKLDKLGDLVDQMDNVKITEGSAAELSPLAGGPEKVVKHPLQNAWTLWFFKNDKGRSWEENQRSIITVTTVEDFWSLYNHIEVASKLPPGSDYSLFKEGIFPDWEDKRFELYFSYEWYFLLLLYVDVIFSRVNPIGSRIRLQSSLSF